jgi:polysaccharide biosynthesis/export protein
MKKIIIYIILVLLIPIFTFAQDYTVGVGDRLRINIIKPENSTSENTVSPDGSISISYIGSINVKGMTITQIQKKIEYELARGYLNFPVVSVSLVESRSRTFTITGGVNKPGNYFLNENTTVLKAITEAGWFTKFASQSKIVVLRSREDRPGYIKINVNIKEILDGESKADVILKSGDIIVVPE